MDTIARHSVRGAFEHVSHLIADGHTRNGAVVSDPIITGRERYEGYCRALAAHRIPLRPELVRIGLPRATQRQRSSGGLLALAAPPGALCTGTSLLTIGAPRAIRQHGLRMLAENGCLGFDDTDWMALAQPRVTVAAQPSCARGRGAAGLRVWRMRGHLEPRTRRCASRASSSAARACATPWSSAPRQRPLACASRPVTELRRSG